MRKVIKASANLVDEFMKYHEDRENYHRNPDGFDKMYEILDKYDDSNGNDTVDVAFKKAPREDQLKMIELIKPDRDTLKPGQKGYCQQMYYDALAGDYAETGKENKAIVETIEELFREGWINEEEFRTDL